jgi:hypothetical protein
MKIMSSNSGWLPRQVNELSFRLYEKILAGRAKYPSHFDPYAKDLIKHLLVSDLSKRYGNLRNVRPIQYGISLDNR